MTREIVVRSWCDAHMAKGERVPGEVSHEVVWDKMARTLDLCAECDAFMVHPLVAILTEVSAASGTAADGGDTTAASTGKRRAIQTGTLRGCIVCEYQTRGTASALTQHVRQVHGVTAVGLTGGVCPICGATHPDSLGNHIAHQHKESEGPESVGDALWWAANHGDPHGVVTAARARLAAL